MKAVRSMSTREHITDTRAHHRSELTVNINMCAYHPVNSCRHRWYHYRPMRHCRHHHREYCNSRQIRIKPLSLPSPLILTLIRRRCHHRVPALPLRPPHSSFKLTMQIRLTLQSIVHRSHRPHQHRSRVSKVIYVRRHRPNRTRSHTNRHIRSHLSCRYYHSPRPNTWRFNADFVSSIKRSRIWMKIVVE